MPVLVYLVITHLCLNSFRICIFRYDNRIGIGWWYYDNFSSNRYGNQTYILIMQNASESFLLKRDCQGHIIFAVIWVPWCEDTNKDLHTYIARITPFARFSPLGLRVIWLFLFWFVFWWGVCVCVCSARHSKRGPESIFYIQSEDILTKRGQNFSPRFVTMCTVLTLS